MISKEQCGDDRFEIINETKEYIINATNIDTSPEEMAVLDSICFRLWQLGLTKRNKDKLKELTHHPTLSECIKEWNEKGFDVDVYAVEIVIYKPSSVDKEDEIEISIRIDNKIISYVNDVELSFDLHHLLSKTLKALENNNETK